MNCRIQGCSEPLKPRTDRPGKFYPYCEEHFRESRRNDRVRENGRRSYRANKAERIKRVVEHQKDNPQVQAYHKDWYQENAEKVKEQARAYGKANLGVRKKSEAKRRSAVGHYTEEQWQARLDFYGHRCYLCGCDWDALPRREKHIEHVIPLSRGGTNWAANLRPACEDCNLHKGLQRINRRSSLPIPKGIQFCFQLPP